MENTGGNKALAAISALLSAAAAFCVFTVPAGVWNYSAEGASLLTGAVAGLLGAGLGYKSGGGFLGSIGLWLGTAALLVGAGLLLGGGYEIDFG